MNQRVRSFALASSLVLLSGFAACLFIDNPDAREPSASTSGGGGGAGGASSTTSGEGGMPPSICERAGGYLVVESIVTDVVEAVIADCRIGAFFAPLSAEQRAHMTGCMAKQMAIVTKCPGIQYDTDATGAACRDMTTSHKGIGVRQEDFDAFLEDVTTTLQAAAIPQDDIEAITPALSFLKKDIVTNSAPGLTMNGCGGDGG